jgi:hypothetical protein
MIKAKWCVEEYRPTKLIKLYNKIKKIMLKQAILKQELIRKLFLASWCWKNINSLSISWEIILLTTIMILWTRYLCIYLSIHPSIYLSIYMYMYMYMCLYMYTCIWVAHLRYGCLRNGIQRRRESFRTPRHTRTHTPFLLACPELSTIASAESPPPSGAQTALATAEVCVFSLA